NTSSLHWVIVPLHLAHGTATFDICLLLALIALQLPPVGAPSPRPIGSNSCDEKMHDADADDSNHHGDDPPTSAIRARDRQETAHQEHEGQGGFRCREERREGR